MDTKSDFVKKSLEESFEFCSVCGSDYDPEEGGASGYFGITPVTFCVWCYSSIVDMVEKHNE